MFSKKEKCVLIPAYRRIITNEVKNGLKCSKQLITIHIKELKTKQLQSKSWLSCKNFDKKKDIGHHSKIGSQMHQNLIG